MSQKLKEQQVDYAYQVTQALIEAIDKTAAKPEKLNQLKKELIENLPEIFEAVMTVTQPEHRHLIYELFKSITNLIRVIAQQYSGKSSEMP